MIDEQPYSRDVASSSRDAKVPSKSAPNPLLTRQLVELRTQPAAAPDVLYESPLRVAVGTLQRATVDQVRATTVVGMVGADDRPEFESLVQRIADEHGEDVQIRWLGESFSVRFSRRAQRAAKPTLSRPSN